MKTAAKKAAPRRAPAPTNQRAAPATKRAAAKTKRRAPTEKRTAGKRAASSSSATALFAAKRTARPTGERWELRLYVAGKTPLSIEAFANLERICEEHLHGRYRIEVVDLLVNPTLARGDQILAVPTLVRQLPPPVKKIIGDFTNAERVLVGLNIRPIKPPRSDP